MKMRFILSFTAAFLILSLTAIKGASPSKDVIILDKTIELITNAQTLYFEGTKPPEHGAQRTVRYFRMKTPDGSFLTRIENTAIHPLLTIHTLFIKNKDGIWDVFTNNAAEISTIAKSDSLYELYPFQRLAAFTQYSYDLNTSEIESNNTRFFLIKGRLLETPNVTDKNSVAKEFAYVIGESDFMPYSLHEVSLSGRIIDLTIHSIEDNQPLDADLFELPASLAKVHPVTMREYMNYKLADVNKILSSPETKKKFQGAQRSRTGVRIVLVMLFLGGLFMILFKQKPGGEKAPGT